MLELLFKKKKKLEKETSNKEVIIVTSESDAKCSLLIARINFETFKSIFKRNKKISKSGPDGYSEGFEIHRFRETDSKGDVKKSIDVMNIRITKTNLEDVERYVSMANNALGVKATLDKKNKIATFQYDVENIKEE